MPISPQTNASPLVFLAGPLRSGSTLLSLMLDRHSGLVAPGEFDFLFDTLGDDGGLVAAQRLPPEYLDDFLGDNRIYLAQDQRVGSEGSTIERIRRFVDKYAHESAQRVLCIHRNFGSAHELFPQAKFIHLSRDPRDCAKSAVAAGFAGNVHYGLGPWLDSEISWERLLPHLEPSQFIDVRYEELVTDPVRELRRVCDFLGVRYEPEMTDLSSTNYSAPSARFANQWRKGMSALDIALVERRAGELMAIRGYEPVGAGVALPLGSREPALWLQNLLARHRRSIRTFGVSLWLQEAVSRHLGLRSWSRSVHLRMHPIIARTLK